MGLLHQRHIIVAISGGIAAYKGAELVRLLKKQGAVVRVILSRGAKEFITPLTLQALSGEPTHSELLDETAEAGMGHIELARWADLVVIAPGTADVIARLAQGRADDLLTTVALATPAPVAVAPAMNQQMWANQATQDNLEQLIGRGIRIIGPDAGEQACGDLGPGRLLEPDGIATALAEQFESRLLDGKRVVITAGPTVEAIDPVRYLSNHSSGKMGYALARACADAGAAVTLITGPVSLSPLSRVKMVPVTTALEMHDAVVQCAPDADMFIGAAAVSDYRPESVAPEKLKKTEGQDRVIALVQNPDIIATVAKLSQRPTLMIGFAAETTDVITHAREKRIKKELDYIVANDVSDPDTTFGSDQNAVHLIGEHEAHYLPLATKQVIAERIVSLVAHHLEATSPTSG